MKSVHSAIISKKRYPEYRYAKNKFGDGIHVLWGIDENGKVHVASIKFDKDKFRGDDARYWLKEHDYVLQWFVDAEEETKIGDNMEKGNMEECQNLEGLSDKMLMEKDPENNLSGKLQKYKEIYHATNIPIKKFNKRRPTFFTGSLDLARAWGQEHYEEYDIIVLFIPINKIIDVTELMPCWKFEHLVINGMPSNTDIYYHRGCNDGYMIRNMAKYKKSHYYFGDYLQLHYDLIEMEQNDEEKQEAISNKMLMEKAPVNKLSGLKSVHSAIISKKRYPEYRYAKNKFGDGIHVLWGIDGDGKVHVASIKFDKDKFRGDDARYWLKEHDYDIQWFVDAEEEGLSFAVYHGSPHSFDKFTMDKIGTGEGVQAYGWGLYFTDKKSIAEWYADKLGGWEIIWVDKKKNAIFFQKMKNRLVTFYDENLNEDDDFYDYYKSILDEPEKLIEWAEDKIISEYKIFKDLGRTKKLINNELREVPLANIEARLIRELALDLIENIKEIKFKKNIYKVKIHGDKDINELNFMDWDKVIGEIIFQKIISSIESEGIKVWHSTDPGGRKNTTINYWIGTDGYAMNFKDSGEKIYQGLSHIFKSEKEASLFLLRAGIDGIKYCTGDTRNKGCDAFNYVLFDEKAVKIEEHQMYGIEDYMEKENVEECRNLEGLSDKMSKEEIFNNTTYHIDCYGSHHNQSDCQIYALYKDSETNLNKIIGYITFSVFNKEYYINYIFVEKEYRRIGVASKLLLKLMEKEKIEWHQIKHSLQTDEGYEFIKNFKETRNLEGLSDKMLAKRIIDNFQEIREFADKTYPIPVETRLGLTSINVYSAKDKVMIGQIDLESGEIIEGQIDLYSGNVETEYYDEWTKRLRDFIMQPGKMSVKEQEQAQLFGIGDKDRLYQSSVYVARETIKPKYLEFYNLDNFDDIPLYVGETVKIDGKWYYVEIQDKIYAKKPEWFNNPTMREDKIFIKPLRKEMYQYQKSFKVEDSGQSKIFGIGKITSQSREERWTKLNDRFGWIKNRLSGARYQKIEEALLKAKEILGIELNCEVTEKSLLISGDTTKIATQTERIPAYYAIAELFYLQPSHNYQDYSKNQCYPENCQTRDYSGDKVEKEKILRIIRDFDPIHLVTDNPSALEGPPVITEPGIVLGGNSRSIAMQIIAKDTIKYDSLYLPALKKKLESFGFNKNAMSKFRNPVLVRIIDIPLSKCSTYSNMLNKGQTQAMNEVTEAIALARQFEEKHDAFENIAQIISENDSDSTFKELVNNPEIARKIIKELEGTGIITPSNTNEWLSGAREFSDKGKTLLEFMLLASILPDKTLLDQVGSYSNKILRAIPQLIVIKSLSPEWNIIPEIQKAVKLEYQRRQTGAISTPEQLINQTSIDSAKIDEKTANVWMILHYSKPRDFKPIMEKYIKTAKGSQGGSMFSEEKTNPGDVLKFYVEYAKSGKGLEGLMDYSDNSELIINNSQLSDEDIVTKGKYKVYEWKLKKTESGRYAMFWKKKNAKIWRVYMLPGDNMGKNQALAKMKKILEEFINNDGLSDTFGEIDNSTLNTQHSTLGDVIAVPDADLTVPELKIEDSKEIEVGSPKPEEGSTKSLVESQEDNSKLKIQNSKFPEEDGLPQLPTTTDILNAHTKGKPLILKRTKPLFNRLLEPFSMLIYGKAGHGKTSLALIIAEDLEPNGKSLYILADKGTIDTRLKEQIERLKIHKDITFYPSKDWANPGVENYLDDDTYKFIIIDKTNDVFNIKQEEFKDLIEKYPNKSFIYVARTNKAGKEYIGDPEIAFKVDTIVLVENMTARTIEKHRDGEVGKTMPLMETKNTWDWKENMAKAS